MKFTVADLLCNVVAWMRKWYEQNRKGLSDVSEALFGVGVYAETGNYMPVKTLLDPQGLEKPGGAAFALFPKALTPRVRNERGYAALGALGGNVGVMMKQTTSIPEFGFEIGMVKTAKHFATAFTPEGMAAMRTLWNSEERRNRWTGGNTEAVSNALGDKTPNAIKQLLIKSMVTNKLGDAVPGLLVGQGIYRDAPGRGMSAEDVMAYTWMLVERTQQSSRVENRSAFQRRGKLGNMIYQFLTTQQQYLQYELRTFREAVADPKNAKKWGGFLRAATLNHFILSSAYNWMGELYKSLLGQEPPEDRLTDWVVGMLTGPYGGAVQNRTHHGGRPARVDQARLDVRTQRLVDPVAPVAGDGRGEGPGPDREGHVRRHEELGRRAGRPQQVAAERLQCDIPRPEQAVPLPCEGGAAEVWL